MVGINKIFDLSVNSLYLKVSEYFFNHTIILILHDLY